MIKLKLGVSPLLLTLLFVLLQVLHLINWSIWWILSPIWITIGFSIVSLAVVLLAMGLMFVAALITVMVKG